LIVAEHASAKWGGEPILPLHYFRNLRARCIEAWLIVHERTRPELRELLPGEQSRILYVRDTWLHRWLFKLGEFFPHQFSFFTFQWVVRVLTQLMARRIARRLIAEHGVNIVHQPIPVSPKEASLMHGLGVPVVIGPMNGGMSYPAGFSDMQNRCVRMFMSVGRWIADIANRLMPGKLRAQTLLVANHRTRGALPRGARGEIIQVVENGVDLNLWSAPSRNGHESNKPIRFVFAGRLVDWKGVNLLIEAFAQVAKQVNSVLDIIGDGRLRAHLEFMAKNVGVGDKVRFHGWLLQHQCAEQFKNADVFVLPSIYECGGAVVLEAMASGLPIVATDWGGPADYVDGSCGILVQPASRDSFVAGMTDAMLKLAADPVLRRRLGEAGRKKAVDVFDWQRKVDRILEIYLRTATRNADQPPAKDKVLQSTSIDRSIKGSPTAAV
jgi:glycosyltransferase involved in cell wall biosynthesis